MRNGVKGIYEEANYFSKAGELAELRTWILAKTLWDPAYDTDRAIDEFLEGYYGEAAGPLRRLIDLLHGKARMEGIHFNINEGPRNALFSGDCVARGLGLLEEARKLAAGKPDLRRRVEAACLPLWYVRITQLLREVGEGGPRRDEARKGLEALFADFDRVAREHGVSHVSEGRSYQDLVREVEKR